MKKWAKSIFNYVLEDVSMDSKKNVEVIKKNEKDIVEKIYQAIKFAKYIYDDNKKLQKYDVEISDLHSGNYGYTKNGYICFDCLYEHGGGIALYNNYKKINTMDLMEYNNLPHIDTINGGDKIVLKEDVFSGDYEKPTHQGFRFIVCEVMGEGGITNSASLKVLNSIGSSAIEFGKVITRPIANLISKGRRMVSMEHGGLNDLYIGDEVNYRGTNYMVDGLSDCNKYVKCVCMSNGNKSELEVQDLMDNSSLIKRN